MPPFMLDTRLSGRKEGTSTSSFSDGSPVVQSTRDFEVPLAGQRVLAHAACFGHGTAPRQTRRPVSRTAGSLEATGSDRQESEPALGSCCTLGM